MSEKKLDIDSDFIRKLAKLLEETGLTDIEYAEGDKRIRCSMQRNTIVAAATPVAVAAPAATAPAAGGAAAAGAAANGTPVKSPMVGTVYLSPAPNSPAFVKVGDTVKAGDTLLIIEAMKVMNPIKAQQGGTVTAILVKDAQPVEFGETLLTIA
ncbi:MAG: acetyl-CoA carboxylase biotin carboxyl carrier protein [Alphaproteobacteria bacterium]|nr:acetyl-CoA carboxylase biotin carboxyl carrier protein [Alphaproteobacteria bacterium]